ncbi:MAG: hypothetical protein GF399_07935 [Candidatus Coatesbacteria bacterium]|nr:hypothetical protein [Candidatus Coatesbacteria bacterium]
MRLRWPAVLALFLSVAPGVRAAAVLQLEWNGSLDYGALGFFEDAFSELDPAETRLVVLRLSSAGGRPWAVEQLVALIRESEIQTAVWVAPAGTRLAGPALAVGWAADYLFGAPGATFGGDGTLSTKVGEELRDVDESHVDEVLALLPETIDGGWAALLSAGFIEFGPGQLRTRGLADGTANNLTQLIELVRHDTAQLLTIERRETGLLWRGLSHLARPTTAFLLYLLAMLAFSFSAAHPGGYFSLIVGGLFLLVALVAFAYLPTSALGLILIPVGVGLVTGDIFLRSRGLVAFLGLAATFFGGLFLFYPNCVAVDTAILVPAVLVTGVFYMFVFSGGLLTYLTDRHHQLSALLNRHGVALNRLSKHRRGWVMLGEELWRARSPQPIPRGLAVRVTDVQGATLIVSPLRGAE